MFEACNNLKLLFSGFNRPWFIAGGWAIDLFVGEKTREHADIEIAIFRKVFKEYLSDWDLQVVSHGEFKPWADKHLELPVHEIHATKKRSGDKLEFLLEDGKQWLREALELHDPKHQWLPYLSY